MCPSPVVLPLWGYTCVSTKISKQARIQHSQTCLELFVCPQDNDNFRHSNPIPLDRFHCICKLADSNCNLLRQGLSLSFSAPEHKTTKQQQQLPLLLVLLLPFLFIHLTPCVSPWPHAPTHPLKKRCDKHPRPQSQSSVPWHLPGCGVHQAAACVHVCVSARLLC